MSSQPPRPALGQVEDIPVHHVLLHPLRLCQPSTAKDVSVKAGLCQWRALSFPKAKGPLLDGLSQPLACEMVRAVACAVMEIQLTGSGSGCLDPCPLGHGAKGLYF